MLAQYPPAERAYAWVWEARRALNDAGLKLLDRRLELAVRAGRRHELAALAWHLRRHAAWLERHLQDVRTVALRVQVEEWRGEAEPGQARFHARDVARGEAQIAAVRGVAEALERAAAALAEAECG